MRDHLRKVQRGPGLRAALVATAVLVVLATCTPEGSWDLIAAAVAGTSEGSIEITFDTSDLRGFLFDVPVPIRLTPQRIDYATAGAAGASIALYDGVYSEGRPALDHEIASWNPDGESIVWVRLPFVAGGSPVAIRLYAGGDAGSVEANPEGVWRNGYVAVLHFDDQDDPWKDSTGFANHGLITNGKTAPAVVPGRAGTGISADLDTDAVSIQNSVSTDTMAPFTWELWLNIPPGIGWHRLFSKGERFLSVRDLGAQHSYQSRINHVSDPPAPDPNWDDVFGAWNSPVRADEWFHVALVWTGDAVASAIDLRVNGRSATRFNSGPDPAYEDGTAIADSTHPLTIANRDVFATANALPGIVDEVFISMVPRSTEWLGFQIGAMNESIVSYDPFVPR